MDLAFKMEFYQIFGWLGLILIQGSTIPQIYKTIKTKDVKGVSLALWIIVFLGLFCYLVYSLIIEDMIYMVSNVLGLIGTILMICLILKYKKPNGT